MNDVYNTISLFDKEMLRNYNLIFSSSNELLKPIMSNFDFKDKKVLTVLGSGDQAFHFYKNGVTNIDLFDVNKLTIYNFYLRYWNMMFNNEYYLPSHKTRKGIAEILSYVRPANEDEFKAMKYWEILIGMCSDRQLNSLFIPRSTIIDKKNEIVRKWKIVSNIKNHNYRFFNVDIAENPNISEKYDYIYTSNIVDYISKKGGALEQYRDSLDNLLADDGTIICTNVINDGANKKEKKVFSEKFDIHSMPKVYKYSKFKVDVPGYYYVRK